MKLRADGHLLYPDETWWPVLSSSPSLIGSHRILIICRHWGNYKLPSGVTSDSLTPLTASFQDMLGRVLRHGNRCPAGGPPSSSWWLAMKQQSGWEETGCLLIVPKIHCFPARHSNYSYCYPSVTCCQISWNWWCRSMRNILSCHNYHIWKCDLNTGISWDTTQGWVAKYIFSDDTYLALQMSIIKPSELTP